MNKTPNSNRIHIGLIGKTNSGKSSLLNAITEQEISIVSPISGTTTDSVSKAMELLPLGPVLFIDTAGFNDSTELGELREKKALSEFKRLNFALLVIDSKELDLDSINEHIKLLKKNNIPYLTILNKEDLLSEQEKIDILSKIPEGIFVSTKNRDSILNLKSKLIDALSTEKEDPKLIEGLVPSGGTVILVVPVDSEAPKGRLILPQVQLIRECLDSGIKCVVVRDLELEDTLKSFKDIDLVITDSQAFKFVDSVVPKEINLTSFSILFARQKGEIDEFLMGTNKIDFLKENDRILIAETCTHNTSHEDIGRVKIPKLLKKYTGKNLEFDFCGGKDYPENLTKYSLIIHCGGCMINRKLMLSRMNEAKINAVPITNYGLVIAKVTGILDRSIEILRG